MPFLTHPSPRRSPLRRRLATPRYVACGRVGAGAWMLTRPHRLPGLLGVDSATATRTSWSVQMLGAREVALGLGTLSSLRRGSNDRAARSWLAAGLLSDAADAVVLATAVRRGRVSMTPGLGVVVVAVLAAEVQFQALRRR